MTDITYPNMIYTNKLIPSNAEPVFQFKLKDPGSAITHLIGFVAAIFATPFLLIQSINHGADLFRLIGLAIFMLSMISLYGASSAYHSFNLTARGNKNLKKIDHMMIFILIAGTYTPICLSVIGGKTGIFLLILVYAIAILGITLKAFWVFCPKWVSSIIYITMGWVCLLAFPQIYASLSTASFIWLLVGGILYTIGGVIYALKLNVFNSIHKHFGSHEIFHLFVLAGSFCHFMTMIYL